jgi:hypothetical protein
LAALSSEVERVCDLPTKLADQRGVPREAVRREHHRVGADARISRRVARNHPAHRACGIYDQTHDRASQRQVCALLVIERSAKLVAQLGSGSARGRVHAIVRVPGILEVPHELERDADLVYEPAHHVARRPCEMQHPVAIAGAGVLRPDISRKVLRIFTHARGALQLGSGRRKHATRTRRVGEGSHELLEHQRLGTGARRRQSSEQSTPSRAGHENVDRQIEAARIGHDLCFRRVHEVLAARCACRARV